jgi:transposase
VAALVGAGYQVYAVNPLASSRYRDRHRVSGAKSDPGDAKMLADLMRTDRHNHRPVAGDSELVEGIKILARVHQSAIWGRRRQLNALRSALREYYPAALEAFGTDLSHHDAIAVLSVAPTPALGRQLSKSKIASALRRGGRTRYIEVKTDEIQTVLRGEHLEAPDVLASAYGDVVRSALRLIEAFTDEIAALEKAVTENFDQHPDAKIVLSLPGIGTVLGARVLGEFGDDRTRFASPKCRKNYAGTSPVTQASGRSHVVLARSIRNRRLADALDRWAFCSLTPSPGARQYYDELKARGKTHKQATRQLANRWSGSFTGAWRPR